jgi:hypothetical protein
MKQIPLSGKYAVGEYAVALVDDDDYERLAKFRWKAKPNVKGSYTYAVRNQFIDGKCKMFRMHREILGLGDEDDQVVDHLNHRTTDNRKSNLRACTVSENNQNRKGWLQQRSCRACGFEYTAFVRSTHAPTAMCESCRQSTDVSRWDQGGHETHWIADCAFCGEAFFCRSVERASYCSTYCRGMARSRRRGVSPQRDLKAEVLTALHLGPATAVEIAKRVDTHVTLVRKAMLALSTGGDVCITSMQSAGRGRPQNFYSLKTSGPS